MSLLRLLAAVVGGLVLFTGLTGCQPAGANQPSVVASTTPGPDFTEPGVALDMVRQLIAAAGSDRLIMVEIEDDTVSVSALVDDEPVTWAYRDGTIGEVTSDLAYVDQAVFDIEDFNLADVGALFEAAGSESGSAENQNLQIVDYSGGEVMMSVSTVPESQTVFFHPNGTMLETLDFNTAAGVSQGITEAVGPRAWVHSIAVQSDTGAWVDYPGAEDTTIRRHRTAKVPVTTNARAETLDLPLFNPELVDPDAIWAVVDSVLGTPDVPEGSDWSVNVDDRDERGTPRMYFSIGPRVLVTDLSGTPVAEE